MKRAKAILSSLLLIVLMGGVAAQYQGGAYRRKKMTAVDLADLVPSALPGWLAADHPLADSPELQKRVEEILKFDSAFFRTYRSGGKEVSVYAAYWLPGKVHYQNIDTHTPDVCWVENGWRMEKLAPLGARKVDGIEVELPNVRIFTGNGARLTVLFWHIEGQKVRESRSQDDALIPFLERVFIRVENVWSSISSEPKQQLFVRVSSTGNIWDELDEEPVKSVLKMIAQAKSGRLFYTMPAGE